MILKNGIDSGIPTVMALDAMFAGIDTTGENLILTTYELDKVMDYSPEQ